MKTSVMLSLESPDGFGKTTHAKRLLAHLLAGGFRAVYVKSPDSFCVFYDTIYRALESGWATRNPVLFQLLQFVNKLHFQIFRLPKLRREMDAIIMDRWDLSMEAYGLASGVPAWIIRIMSAMLVRPDQVFLLTRDEPLRESPRDSYERDSRLQSKVSMYYYSGAWRERYKSVVDVQVRENPDETFKDILRNVDL